MVRVFHDVKRIVLHPTNVTILTPKRFRSVPRGDWNVVIEGVKQVQTYAHDVRNKATLFMDDNIECRVYQDDKEVLCGVVEKILKEEPIR